MSFFPDRATLAWLGWGYLAILVVALAITAASWLVVRLLIRGLPPVQKGTVAFFHPFADGGGGGERVLWCAVKAVQQASPNAKIVIYVRAGPSAEQLARDASERFNITLDRPIHVVPLKGTDLILPERYPRFTLLGQAWGAVRLGREALSLLVPELFIETTGWAFTFPLARLAGCRVACYVHYPTVSSDMINRVSSGIEWYNNDAAISGSRLKSLAKQLYYRTFALLYGLVGACSQATMVNSSWTLGHIRALWWNHGDRGGGAGGAGAAAAAADDDGDAGPSTKPAAGQKRRRLNLVYPPCDVESLRRLPLDRRLKQLYLVSVAQFRPEKNHRLQLEAFALAKRGAGPGLQGQAIRVARLKFVGSCRNPDDERRREALEQYAAELGISDDVDWCVNVPYSELRALLADAVGGLHSMIDEHFGICVVEYMAAGVIPIAHDSGGPRADIVVPVPATGGWNDTMDTPPGVQSMEALSGGDGGSGAPPGASWQRTGFRASSAEEYADAITRVLVMDQRDRLIIAAAAQRHADRFSTQRFMDAFTAVIAPMLPK